MTVKAIIAIALPLFIAISGCISLKKAYRQEVQANIALRTCPDSSILDAAAIAHLPLAVQRHLGYTCFVGKPLVYNAAIVWKDVTASSNGKPGHPAGCSQYNAVSMPARVSWMKFRQGLLPVEGLAGYGPAGSTEKFRLLRLVGFTRKGGESVERDALALMLAEALMVPGYAVQPYMQWQAIDNSRVRASLTYDGITATGTCYFNSHGVLEKFVPNTDKYYGRYCEHCMLYPPYMQFSDYEELSCPAFSPGNCIKYPSRIRLRWHISHNTHIDMQATVGNVQFNVSQL